uniref:Claudin n=1 Tax=Seriola dumerili TaxID=41447 RepID=A0A3B4V090_SERDU
MVSFGLEVVGVTLSVLGWALSIVSCALPMWRVSAFIGANIVTAQVYWEGLWMSCVFQSTGQMQCKVYDSMLALPPDLQAARALTVLSIIVGIIALLISMVGAKCTNCIEDEGFYSPLIPSGQKMEIGCTNCIEDDVIIRDFYNPLLTNAQRRELGASLYIGWGAAALLLIGGAMLCSSCPPKEKKYKPPRMAYSAPRSTSAGGGYDRKDYV